MAMADLQSPGMMMN